MEVKQQIGILQSLGYGKKTIAQELGLSKNTVKSYLDVSEDKGGDSSNESRKEDLYAFFPYCRTELPRKGVTRQASLHPITFPLLSQGLRRDPSLHSGLLGNKTSPCCRVVRFKAEAIPTRQQLRYL